jgi:hypothetical protein
METFSRIMFYVFVFCALVRFPVGRQVAAGVVALFFLSSRSFSQWYVMKRTAKKLGAPKFQVNLFFFDFIQPLVNGYFYLCKIIDDRRTGFWRYGKRNRSI